MNDLSILRVTHAALYAAQGELREPSRKIANVIRAIEGEMRVFKPLDDCLVTHALNDGRLHPGQELWARSYCGRDRKSFQSYLDAVKP